MSLISMWKFDIVFLLCGMFILAALHGSHEDHDVSPYDDEGDVEALSEEHDVDSELSEEDLIAEHDSHFGLYMGVFGALFGLTVFEVGLPIALGWAWTYPFVILMVAIAMIKAALVMFFFMHLKGEHKSIYFVMGLVVFYIPFMLAIMCWDANVIYGFSW